ncbi:hypothetical protein [Komagataeibacter xylinus]|uniref:hypothetical protein n=1 Tax=Komagataeibacter xylinus TaxID=28448 RepID=UPI00280A8513|nr:hypothetical protein [Komagataeibacter xylinus]
MSRFLPVIWGALCATRPLPRKSARMGAALRGAGPHTMTAGMPQAGQRVIVARGLARHHASLNAYTYGETDLFTLQDRT